MKRKIIIPLVLFFLLLIFFVSIFGGGSRKVIFEWNSPSIYQEECDSIVLKVYVENSGSMDAYMCPGSDLKDAVFDYVSDLKKYAKSCGLYYINSKIIPFNGNLDLFIKNLTPSSFALYGGNRKSTDLRIIIDSILKNHDSKTVSILVSDCILDVSGNAKDYFGNCQVSIKNSFNNALTRLPALGVEILQLESKFDGFWYCGQNSKKLSDVKRPYYIWIIGNQNHLAYLNSKVKVEEIIGGIKNYCAYAPAQSIPFNIDRTTYVVNHTGKIYPQISLNLNGSLQDEKVIENVNNYKESNPLQMHIVSVQKIMATDDAYSHVVKLEIDDPGTLKSGVVSFSYPYLQNWIIEINDSTGDIIHDNIKKTTGILYLIKGVAEAYKNNLNYGEVSFNIKNK